jgi:hypothetical protein
MLTVIEVERPTDSSCFGAGGGAAHTSLHIIGGADTLAFGSMARRSG